MVKICVQKFLVKQKFLGPNKIRLQKKCCTKRILDQKKFWLKINSRPKNILGKHFIGLIEFLVKIILCQKMRNQEIWGSNFFGSNQFRVLTDFGLNEEKA